MIWVSRLRVDTGRGVGYSEAEWRRKSSSDLSVALADGSLPSLLTES